jgi:hypothetical protein
MLVQDKKKQKVSIQMQRPKHSYSGFIIHPTSLQTTFDNQIIRYDCKSDNDQVKVHVDIFNHKYSLSESPSSFLECHFQTLDHAPIIYTCVLENILEKAFANQIIKTLDLILSLFFKHYTIVWDHMDKNMAVILALWNLHTTTNIKCTLMILDTSTKQVCVGYQNGESTCNTNTNSITTTKHFYDTIEYCNDQNRISNIHSLDWIQNDKMAMKLRGHSHWSISNQTKCDNSHSFVNINVTWTL